MRRLQLNTTLDKKDLDFIRDNLGVMTKTEMAIRLKCSEGKIRENARIAGIEFPSKNRHGFTKAKDKAVDSEFFNVNECENWLFSNQRYMDR